MTQARYSQWFVLITAVFITCLITANITAVKLMHVFGLIVPAAIVIFPISYIAGDVLTEVYGYRQARWVIWLGFCCNLIAVIAIWLGQVLPAASFWDGQAAYERILGYTPRLLFASFLAYLVGEFANSFVLAKMKIWTGGRWLWTRTIGSTIFGEGIDSLLFYPLAFYGGGLIPDERLPAIMLVQFVSKVGVEVLLTPFTYKIVAALKRAEREDYYDRETDFNPFTLTT